VKTGGGFSVSVMRKGELSIVSLIYYSNWPKFSKIYLFSGSTWKKFGGKRSGGNTIEMPPNNLIKRGSFGL
jgi:hypothetical protein